MIWYEFLPDAVEEMNETARFYEGRKKGLGLDFLDEVERTVAIQFPKRAYGGIWNGRLIWGRLSEGRVRTILKNPAYAGVYAFGRFRCRKQVSGEGQIHSKITTVPMSSWTVTRGIYHLGESSSRIRRSCFVT